jgi:hypothetical protein
VGGVLHGRVGPFQQPIANQHLFGVERRDLFIAEVQQIAQDLLVVLAQQVGVQRVTLAERGTGVRETSTRLFDKSIGPGHVSAVQLLPATRKHERA